MLDTSLILPEPWLTFSPKNNVLFLSPAGKRIRITSVSDDVNGELRFPDTMSLSLSWEALSKECRSCLILALKRMSYDKAIRQNKYDIM